MLHRDHLQAKQYAKSVLSNLFHINKMIFVRHAEVSRQAQEGQGPYQLSRG